MITCWKCGFGHRTSEEYHACNAEEKIPAVEAVLAAGAEPPAAQEEQAQKVADRVAIADDGQSSPLLVTMGHFEPAPPQAGASDVIERMRTAYIETGECGSCSKEGMAAAYAVALAHIQRTHVPVWEGLESLDQSEIVELERIFGDCCKQQIDYLISFRRARLVSQHPAAEVEK
jgi:hypothetical protein